MRYLLLFVIVGCRSLIAGVPATAPASAPGVTDKLPFIHVDIPNRQVLVECEAVNAKIPLEFLCVLAGTAEHETILRTHAKPSNIHLALLMLGLKPGHPMRYVADSEKWIPPEGPALDISVRFMKDGKVVSLPAWQLFRDLQNKKPMPPQRWIFAGSKVYNTGQYAADITGQIISIVNFDYTLIDVPQVASSANDQLQYEVNPDTVPPEKTAVTLVLQPQ